MAALSVLTSASKRWQRRNLRSPLTRRYGIRERADALSFAANDLPRSHPVARTRQRVAATASRGYDIAGCERDVTRHECQDPLHRPHQAGCPDVLAQLVVDPRLQRQIIRIGAKILLRHD